MSHRRKTHIMREDDSKYDFAAFCSWERTDYEGYTVLNQSDEAGIRAVALSSLLCITCFKMYLYIHYRERFIRGRSRLRVVA